MVPLVEVANNRHRNGIWRIISVDNALLAILLTKYALQCSYQYYIISVEAIVQIGRGKIANGLISQYLLLPLLDEDETRPERILGHTRK